MPRHIIRVHVRVYACDIFISLFFSHLSCAEFLGSLSFARLSGSIHVILTEVNAYTLYSVLGK